VSDAPQGPGWWQASDGKWYPPETAPPGASPYASPSPYGAPGYPGYAVPSGSNAKAIAALVCGILSIPLCCLGIVPGAVAIFLGWTAKAEIDRGEAPANARGMALAGFICGIIGTAIWVAYLLFWVLSLALSSSSN